MLKIRAIAAIALLMLTISACGTTNPLAANDPTPDTTEEERDGGYLGAGD